MDNETNTLKKTLHVSQLRIYAIALLLTGSVSEIVWSVFNAIQRNPELPFTVLYALLLLGGAWLVYRRFKAGAQAQTEIFDAEEQAKLKALHDQYLKRLLHSIALFISAFAVFIGAELSFYFFGNSKSAELAENMASNILLIQLPLYLLIKNSLGLCLVSRWVGYRDEKLARSAAPTTRASSLTVCWSSAALPASSADMTTTTTCPSAIRVSASPTA